MRLPGQMEAVVNNTLYKWACLELTGCGVFQTHLLLTEPSQIILKLFIKALGFTSDYSPLNKTEIRNQGNQKKYPLKPSHFPHSSEQVPQTSTCMPPDKETRICSWLFATLVWRMIIFTIIQFHSLGIQLNNSFFLSVDTPAYWNPDYKPSK